MKNQDDKRVFMAAELERRQILEQQARGEFSLSQQLAEHPVSRMRAYGFKLPDSHPASILAARRR